MNVRTLALAGVAATLITLPAGAAGSSGNSESTAAAAANVQYAAVECMTDDGYGRRRPCSALYRTQKPNWRAGNECMTDEGGGRFRPCNSLYKAKHDKSKK